MKLKNAWFGYALSILAVVVFCVGAKWTFADSAPQEVQDNEQPIAEYQKVIEDNRPEHEAFMNAKQKQAALEKQNNDLGWRTNWETLKPVPIEPVFLPRL